MTIGERVFTILFPEIIRPLTDSEREKLKESIREYGVVTPIGVDEADGVIDGWNRLQIAAELGYESVPVKVHTGLDDKGKAELALSLNEARRHLTAADQAKMQENREERIKRRR